MNHQDTPMPIFTHPKGTLLRAPEEAIWLTTEYGVSFEASNTKGCWQAWRSEKGLDRKRSE